MTPDGRTNTQSTVPGTKLAAAEGPGTEEQAEEPTALPHGGEDSRIANAAQRAAEDRSFDVRHARPCQMRYEGFPPS
jgi:hypothetical protein